MMSRWMVPNRVVKKFEAVGFFGPRFCFSALKCERPGTIPLASNSYQGVGGRQPIKDSLGSNRCSMALLFEPPQKMGKIVKNLTKKFSKEFEKRLDFLSILCYNVNKKRKGR